jgi:hypothetical protein
LNGIVPKTMTPKRATRASLFALVALSLCSTPPAQGAHIPATSLDLRAALTSEHQTASGYTLREDLYKTGARVGTSSGVCLEKRSARAEPTSATCRLTLRFSSGTIVIAFKIAFATDSGTLSVVGGTGTYSGARGKGTVANGQLMIELT